MALSAGEITLLKQARELVDMMATPGWKIYQTIIEEQIKTRLDLVMLPAHDLPQEPGEFPLDGMTRFGSLENIKGAFNGLRLALSLPQSILDEATRLRASSSAEGEGK